MIQVRGPVHKCGYCLQVHRMGTECPTPPVLDACCGKRAFWFNHRDPRALFIDKRRESHVVKDSGKKTGTRTITIDPDIIADFRSLPFADDRFDLVVFDPPHLAKKQTGWMAKAYGRLGENWREEISQGFAECFRVLRPKGCLVFKWAETDIPVSEVLTLTSETPLFGNRCGKHSKTHWIVFLKP